MSDFYSKIDSIISEDFNLKEGIMYIPRSLDVYNYKLKVFFSEIKTGLSVDAESLGLVDYQISLVNSKNNLKYKLLKGDSSWKSNGVDFFFSFILNQESDEASFVDYLELKVINATGVTSTSRYKVQVKPIKTSSKVFEYEVKNKLILESNLVDSRYKLGFAKWSTVFKNKNSVAGKMMEALDKYLYSSPSKVRELLKLSYSLDQPTTSFKEVVLKDRPQNVVRLREESEETLVEAFDVLNSIKSLDIKEKQENIQLISVILEPYSEKAEEFEEINKLLPTTLYIKLRDSELYDSCTVLIRGEDEFGKELTEFLDVRFDIWTRIQKSYYKIEAIEGLELPIEIANYVDLSIDHYVDNNPFLTPSIIKSNDLTPFKPRLLKKNNYNQDRQVLVIKDDSFKNTEEHYKFSFEETSINSMYLTENLDLIYTATTGDSHTLCVTKLGLDFKKKFANKTTNNSSYIEVSETNPFIGDWVDVKIKLKEWLYKTKTKAFIIQVLNDDTLFYYDVIEDRLVSERVYIYTDHTSLEDSLDFSFFLENDSPYIITLFNEHQTEYCSAQSSCDLLRPYNTISLPNKSSLILKDNKITLVDFEEQDTSTVIFSELTDNDVLVYFHSNNRYNLEYSLDFYGYTITSKGSTIDRSFYEVLNSDHLSSTVCLKIRKDLIKSLKDEQPLNFRVGCSFNRDYSVDDSSLRLTIKTKEEELSVDLRPTTDETQAPLYKVVIEEALTIEEI